MARLNICHWQPETFFSSPNPGKVSFYDFGWDTVTWFPVESLRYSSFRVVFTRGESLSFILTVEMLSELINVIKV